MKHVVTNQAEASLVAQLVVYDAITEAGGVEDVAINNSMIQYARNAYNCYNSFQERLHR